MKKSLKIRLTLNRETLRNLDPDEDAERPGGGVQAITKRAARSSSPTPAYPQTCPTHCGQACACG